MPDIQQIPLPQYRLPQAQLPGGIQSANIQPPDMLGQIGPGIESGFGMGIRAQQVEIQRQLAQQKAIEDQGNLLKSYAAMHDVYSDIPSMQKQVLMKGVIPAYNQLAQMSGRNDAVIDPSQVNFEEHSEPLKEFSALLNQYANKKLTFEQVTNGVHAIENEHFGNERFKDQAEKQLNDIRMNELLKIRENPVSLGMKDTQFNIKTAADFAKNVSGNMKVRNTLALNQQKLNNIGAAKALIDQVQQQPGGADQRQMFEISLATVRSLMANNMITEGEVKMMTPSTYKGNINKFLEKVSNNPTGVDAQQFVQRYKDTLEREYGVSSQQIEAARTEILGGYKKWVEDNPDYSVPVLKSFGIQHPTLNPNPEPMANPFDAQPSNGGGLPEVGSTFQGGKVLSIKKVK